MNALFSAWVNLRNSLDWWLRNSLTWSPSAREPAEEKGEADARETHFMANYFLFSARQRMTNSRWQRNLAVLERLESASRSPALDKLLRQTGPLRILDIGSKNFDYVDALAGFFSRCLSHRDVQITGLEIDAHRRYTDLRTRRAWAEHYVSFVPSARYFAADLLNHTETYHAITWFFPFLTEFPLLKWGLPLSLFQPATLLAHAWSLLLPGGVLILVNQTDAELETQCKLLAELEAPFDPRQGRVTVAYKTSAFISSNERLTRNG
jgi:hypothetical protein